MCRSKMKGHAEEIHKKKYMHTVEFQLSNVNFKVNLKLVKKVNSIESI